MENVLLLQNDLQVGQGLRRFIEADVGLRVCGLAVSLEQARRHLDKIETDLLVADLRIQNERLTELLRERRGLRVRPQVLAVAMSADDPHLMQALRHGADGYFVHGDPLKGLSRVIRQVLAGESQMSPQIARHLQAHFKQPSPSCEPASDEPPALGGLTDNERRMLVRLSQGYLLHEIAREMHTSEHSLGLRSRSLYRKLQLDLQARALSRQPA